MADEDRELSYPERDDRTEDEAGEEQAEQRENRGNEIPDTRQQQEQAARNISILETLRQLHGGMEQEKQDRERAEQTARQWTLPACPLFAERI